MAYAVFDGPEAPYYADANDPLVFNQESTDRAAVIMENFKGVPFWTSIEEEENFPEHSPRIGQQKTHSILKYAASIDIPKNYFDDDLHATVAQMVKEMAMKAKMTQNRNALQLLSGGFATYTTADGSYIFADDHTTLSGDTVDNKGTSALSVSALETAMVALMEQKDQTGEVIGHVPACLVVPPALFREAIEITKSEKVSDSAENAVNWVSSEFGIMVKQSPYLGAAAGGSDTNWFLLAKNHKLFRFVRQPLVTDLVDYKYQRNDNFIYKGSYREVVAAQSFEGIWGSTGAG